MTRDNHTQTGRDGHDEERAQPVLDALLRHRLGGDGPAANLEQRIRDTVAREEAGVPADGSPDAASDREGRPVHPVTMPDRRLLVMAAAATVLIGVLITLLVSGSTDPPLPDGVQPGPNAVYTVHRDGDSVRVDLHRGWMVVSPGGPAVRVGNETIANVTGRVLVTAGEPPGDSDSATMLENELLANGFTEEDITMLHPRTNWLSRTGLAVLVIAGSAVINGQPVAAQEPETPLAIPVLLEWHGDDAVYEGSYSRLFLVESTFRTKWAEWFPGRPAPTVDFVRCMVLVALSDSTGGFETIRVVEAGTACRVDYQSLDRSQDAAGAGYGVFVLPRLVGSVAVRRLEDGEVTERKTFVTVRAPWHMNGAPPGNEKPPTPTVLAVSDDGKVIVQWPEGSTDAAPERNARLIVLRRNDATAGDPVAELIVTSVVGRVVICDVAWNTAPIRMKYAVAPK